MLRALVPVALATALALPPPEPVTYVAPTPAPVSDPFRPPSTPYARGNRGVEYDTDPGDEVRAAASGTVTFAGSVAGRRYVTLQHADGVRTTYGPLGAVAPGLARRSAVARGEVVGTAAGRVLWTARLGAEAYVDPAVLVAASGSVRVRLVPDRSLGPR